MGGKYSVCQTKDTQRMRTAVSKEDKKHEKEVDPRLRKDSKSGNREA